MVIQKQADFDTRKTKTNDLKQREKSLYEQYAQVDDLKQLLDKSSNELDRRKANQQSYQQLCQNLDLTPADDRVASEQSIKNVENKKLMLESSIKKVKEDAHKKGAALHTQEQEVKGIREEIDEIRKNPVLTLSEVSGRPIQRTWNRSQHYSFCRGTLASKSIRKRETPI